MANLDKEWPSCPNCRGELLVCESHPHCAWPSECECSLGIPCPVCNAEDGRPRLPEGLVVDE